MADDDFKQDEGKVNRRALLAALFAAAVVAPVATLLPEEVEAQERQFTGVRHEPRVERPRSHTRGRRRHRRVARVHHRGRAKPLPENPAQQ